MPPRGLLLILIAGLILAIGAISAARRDDGGGTTTTVTTQAPPTTALNPGGVEANVITATLPADRVVHAKVGDEVDLTVTSEAPDIAMIVNLAVKAPVGPGITSPIRFTALQTGDFPVVLQLAQTVIGRIAVTDGAGAG